MNYTTNGARQYTVENPLIDLFFNGAALRNQLKSGAIDSLENLFSKAFAFDNATATKIAVYLRDPRNGQGEKAAGQAMLKMIASESPRFIYDNLDTLFGEYSCYQDAVKLAKCSNVSDIIINWHCQKIATGDRLAAKWAPRLHSDDHELAIRYRDFLGLTNKEYRKLIKDHSDTVEQTMCQGKFSEINYSTVPSLAMKTYKKAFRKNDPVRFEEFTTGDSKANSSVLYPHQITQMCKTDAQLAQKLWDNLPNYIKPDEKILFMVDVSGSMFDCDALLSKDLHCGDVAMALGLYCSERLAPPFKNCVLTFESTPRLLMLPTNGTLAERLAEVNRLPWGGSTNFEAAYQNLLDTARMFNASPEDMPTMIICASDMQFDMASSHNRPHFELIKERYEAAGYKMPRLVFWQLNSKMNGSPAPDNAEGVALVSGFSPVIIKSVLEVDIEKFTPENIMKEAISYIDLDFTWLSENLTREKEKFSCSCCG